MSIRESNLKSVRPPGQQINNSIPRKLKLPQLVTIMVLVFFNTQLLEYFPIEIGPLTSTMLMELISFFLIFPSLLIYFRNLDTRDRHLFFVGFCMFLLSLINLSGVKGESQQKIIFTSLYAYFLSVCFFSGLPEYGIWLRRLHLLPALATAYSIAGDVFSVSGIINYEFQIRDNYAACYLVIVLPICWVQYQSERGFFRLLNFIVLIATPVTLVLTASRTAFVVFLIVTISMLIAKKFTKKGILGIVLLLIFLSLFILVPEQSTFRNRLSTLQDPVAALDVDRMALWKAALLSIKEHPLFGGDFRADVLRLVLEAAPESNYAGHIAYGVARGNFGVHNGYLAVIVDFGIIVAFFYFSFFFSLGKDLFHTLQRIRNEARRIFLVAGLISLVGYAIANIAFHFYISVNFFILWAMLQSSIKNSLLEEEIKA